MCINSEEDTARWEAICQRCGDCCFEKTIDERGVVHTLAIPCRFLDIHTRRCRIYHQRLQAEEDCIQLTPENLPELDWMPENCAYRTAFSDLKKS
ncbi:MAG TPA: YkgJ family cysteine cluster protein [Malonomonas sp.]